MMAREIVGPMGANALLPVADADGPFVQRIRDGDLTASAPLWEKYERPLYRFFVKRTENRQEAEDLTSETLIAALQSIPQFRGAAPEDNSQKNCTFRTYLQAIARYKLARWARRRRTHKELRLSNYALSPEGKFDGERAERMLESQDTATNPLETVLDRDKKDTVCFALAGIDSNAQYKVLLLHYLGGLPHQTIATALRVSPEIVNSRLQDGRKALRRCYIGYIGP